MATSTSHTPISWIPADLEPLIQEERTKCTSLGVQLKIPLLVLQQLERQSKVKKPIRECFLEMWQQWFKDNEDRKWSEIYEALKQQRHNGLKNSLEKNHKADTPVQPDFNFEGELKEMIPKWYQFGCALGVSTTDLNIIKENGGSLEVYMISMLEEWKENHEDTYTWETLQEALRVIGNQRLAKSLEEHRLKDKQDSVMKVPSNSKGQTDGEGSSDGKYGCKVFYQRRGVDNWKITFNVFPSDKSDRVIGELDDLEGPSCTFDLEADTVKIVPKEQPGWSSKVYQEEVTKASVDAYTGAGKPPSCEMTVTAASSHQYTLPFLEMDVMIKGSRPPQHMKLERPDARYPSILVKEHILKDKQAVNTAIEAFNHWVTIRLSKFRTMGAPGSGKTSVLDLTMGKPPATERESTDCAEPPTHMVARDVIIAPMLAHEMVWETVTKERMNEMVGKAFKAAIDQQKCRNISQRAFRHPGSIEMLAPPRLSPRVLAHSVSNSDTRSEMLKTSETSQTEQQPLKVIADMVDRLEEIEGSMEIMDVHWVFTQDTGGQPCYQSVAPLLLRENSCSVITTKLNEKLESKPEFAFFIKGKPIPMSSTKIQLTNLQMIETLVKSQASVNPSLSSTQAPKYIIVGTHEDKADECEETIKTKNAILEERMSGLEDQRIDNGGSIIFPINAVNPDNEERKKNAKWLREKILSSEATVEKRVNVRWFGLLLHLITEDKDVYTLSECLEAGETLKMDEDEIFQALEFFHGLGIIIHFRTRDLEGVIIVKVKVVFSTLSLLLGISFIDRDTLDHEFKLHLNPRTQERLQVYGRFNKELLNQSQFKFSDIFTAKYFLNLLEHVTAITAVGEDEYFLPSALAYATDEEIKLRVKGEPWIIRLTREKECCEPIDVPPPQAYLSSVFITVMKSSSSKLPSPKSRFSQQYCNAMSLSYSSGGFIHFIQRVHQIEVYSSLCDDQLSKCYTIRFLVLKATKITEEKLNIPSGFLIKHDAFLCPCEDSSDHVCIYNTDMNKAKCEESEEYYELNSSQQRWLDEAQGVFGDSKPSSQEPSTVKPDTSAERDVTEKREEDSLEDTLLTSDDLLDILERLSDLVSDKLQKLGLKLGLKITTLKKLKDSCSSDDFGQSVMLSWLNQEDNVKQPSWRSLVDALESDIVKERVIAQNIRDWLNSR